MPYKNPEDRKAQQKRYRASEHGREVRRRISAAYYARKRGEQEARWNPDPQPLAQVISQWRT